MMWPSSLNRVWLTLNRIYGTRYPGFIFGLPLSQNEIPVFIYHDVDPVSFSDDLMFLCDNGYRTLSTDEFFEQRQNSNGQKSVLLTFDDALQNFWDVAFPLLKQFNAQATLFAPTAWMRGRRNGENGDVGRDAAEDQQFMTWEELRICDHSGHVDVQSHAHRHALVYTSSTVVGFASPALLSRYHLYDWPMRREAGRDRLGYPPRGTPIFQATPLLSAPHRVLENEAAVRACQAEVEKEGPSFFDRPDWRRRLQRIMNPFLTEPLRKIPDEDFTRLVASEFEQAQAIFQAELHKSVRYLAYPWMLGSELSLRLAKQSGLKAAFGVGIDFRRIARIQAPLPVHGRFKGEWLRFLPGKGRLKLHRILPNKLKTFTKTQHLAH